MKGWMKITIGVTAVSLIGVIGYFVYPLIASQQSSNSIRFEKFGLAVLPGSQFTTTVGELGATQIPATFAEGELSPEERVVESLVRNRNALLEENELFRLKIEQLEQRVAELENYKETNERYAPEQFNIELERVRREIEERLRALPEAENYSSLMIELMAVAAQQEYTHTVRENDRMMDEARKAILVQRYLPTYAFCVGNALSIAANNSGELRAIASWLQEPALNPLPNELRADLDIVLPPCQVSFREALDQVLNAAIVR